MTTREAMDRLPEEIRDRIECYRSQYRKAKSEPNENKRYIDTQIVRAEAWGYIKALRDTGAATERQRQILTVYATV